MEAGPIYHLAPASELRAGCGTAGYAPRRFAEDGFVHCAGSAEVALSVAADYYADCDEPLLVLAIDPARLTAELRFEGAAPLEGGGHAHLALADRFPHVYGPIDLAAVTGVGELSRLPGRERVAFRWPERLEPLDRFLARG